MCDKKTKKTTTIKFRTDTKTKEKLDKKAKELNTTTTELIKDGIERVLSEDKPLKSRVGIMVENQIRFNQLFQYIEERNLIGIKSTAIEIYRGEQEAWQL